MLKSGLGKVVVTLTLLSLTQAACYNTYFIDKTELSKLGSSVEQREIVEVLGDCPVQSKPASAYKVLGLDGSAWAQADAPAAPAAPAEDAPAPAAPAATANDGTSTAPAETNNNGCTKVPVSTANTLNLVMVSGDRKRVTPFNFIMSETQVVSPEYNLLEQLNTVEGAEVKQFSTWKTVAMISGATVATIGTFVAISLLAGDSGGFAGE